LPTSGGRSVGVVRSRTQATALSFSAGKELKLFEMPQKYSPRMNNIENYDIRVSISH
jgi:hypothetical protein